MVAVLLVALSLSGGGKKSTPAPIPLAQLPINPNTGHHIVRSDREVAISVLAGDDLHLDVPEQVPELPPVVGQIYDLHVIDGDTLWLTALETGRTTIVAKTRKRGRKITIHLEITKP